jgi:hypothetical protein
MMELEFYKLGIGEKTPKPIDFMMSLDGDPARVPRSTHQEGVMRIAVYADVHAIPWELMFRMLTVMIQVQPEVVSFQGFDRRRGGTITTQQLHS